MQQYEKGNNFIYLFIYLLLLIMTSFIHHYHMTKFAKLVSKNPITLKITPILTTIPTIILELIREVVSELDGLLM